MPGFPSSVALPSHSNSSRTALDPVPRTPRAGGIPEKPPPPPSAQAHSAPCRRPLPVLQVRTCVCGRAAASWSCTRGAPGLGRQASRSQASLLPLGQLPAPRTRTHLSCCPRRAARPAASGLEPAQQPWRQGGQGAARCTRSTPAGRCNSTWTPPPPPRPRRLLAWRSLPPAHHTLRAPSAPHARSRCSLLQGARPPLRARARGVGPSSTAQEAALSPGAQEGPEMGGDNCWHAMPGTGVGRTGDRTRCQGLMQEMSPRAPRGLGNETRKAREPVQGLRVHRYPSGRVANGVDYSHRLPDSPGPSLEAASGERHSCLSCSPASAPLARGSPARELRLLVGKAVGMRRVQVRPGRPRQGTPHRASPTGHPRQGIPDRAPRTGHPAQGTPTGHPAQGTLHRAPRPGHPGHLCRHRDPQPGGGPPWDSRGLAITEPPCTRGPSAQGSDSPRLRPMRQPRLSPPAVGRSLLGSGGFGATHRRTLGSCTGPPTPTARPPPLLRCHRWGPS